MAWRLSEPAGALGVAAVMRVQRRFEYLGLFGGELVEGFPGEVGDRSGRCSRAAALTGGKGYGARYLRVCVWGSSIISAGPLLSLHRPGTRSWIAAGSS
jgi:hypothetical protein